MSLGVIWCNEIAEIEAVGLFAVPKDEQWDRLILNPTVVNSRNYAYSSYTKTLAPGYLITSVQLGPQEKLLISSDDLCEFYYIFRVSKARSRRNAIGLKFDSKELMHLKCFNPALLGSECYICLNTMAMGDSLAVEVAQQSHMTLLQNLASCMIPGEALQYRQPCPRGPFFELLTIDDHIGLQRVSMDHSLEDVPTRDQEVFAASERAYREVKLTAHPGKRQRQVEHTTVLGAEVHGLEGRVSAPRARIAILCYITGVICKGVIKRKILQALLGCWTHICLFRRPVFAILDKVYHEGAQFDPDRLFRMSSTSQVINELSLLCVLAPTMQTNLRAEPVPALFMMDASPFGGGICRASFPEVAVRELWRHTEQRGFYTKLQQGPNAALRELGLEHEEF